jgi:hypothetical protein
MDLLLERQVEKEGCDTVMLWGCEAVLLRCSDTVSQWLSLSKPVDWLIS